MRNIPKIYNPLNQQQLTEISPNFKWDEFFTALGRPQIKSAIVTSPKFMTAISSLVEKISLADWKAYLSWHILHQMAQYLPKNIFNEDFKLRTMITRQTKPTQRWKLCAKSTEEKFGLLIRLKDEADFLFM